MAVRPILRPAVWTEEESAVPYRHHRSPPAYPPISLPQQPPSQQPLPRERNIHYLDDAEDPPRKKKRFSGVPAIYYPPPLSPSELIWRDRCAFLYHRGYQLRPRYQPHWSPTRMGNSRHYHSGEDHIMQILPQVLDAIRRQDGLVVCIKMITERRKLHALKIIEYFSSRRLQEESRNHVVPYYDAFSHDQTPGVAFMVTPVLRRFDDPGFMWVGEVVDFVNQVLDGLVFLHSNNVAHHNIAPEHIMMDARSLIPTGWHFVAHFCEPDGMTKISPLDRRSHPVRYYFIGFGNCLHFPPDAQPLVMDYGGIDDDVPELSTAKPYNPFKYDVYTLGNVLLKELFRKYSNLEFLSDLIALMRTPSPEKRPTANQVLTSWHKTRSTLDLDELDDTALIAREPTRIMVTSASASASLASPVEDNVSESSSSASARSDKRDISSILNK